MAIRKRRALATGLMAALLATTAAITGCANKEKENPPETAERRYQAADLDPRTVAASNAFGLKLFKRLREAEPGANVWISPLSVSSALAVAYSGASGKTAEAMAGTLGLGGMTADESGDGYRKLLDLLNRPVDPGIGMATANSLWLRKGAPFRDDYLEEAEADYGAELRTLDFAKKADALKAMNGWVKERTNGKIKHMIDAIDGAAMMYILNAVSYRAAWTMPFNANNTEEAKFHVSETEAVPAKMMAQGGTYEYAETDDYQAIRLPLGKNASASFVVLLPKPGAKLGDLTDRLADDPALLTADWPRRLGQIELPRFRVEDSSELNDPLKALGMGEAFDPKRASFAGIAPEPPNLYIGRVLHKTFLDVNEDGVEAAAATAIEMEAGAAPAEDPFRMTVDRPFLAAIADAETGAVLFVGAITNPGED